MQTDTLTWNCIWKNIVMYIKFVNDLEVIHDAAYNSMQSTNGKTKLSLTKTNNTWHM